MPSGSYLSTDVPFTGASAKRIVFPDACRETRGRRSSPRGSRSPLGVSGPAVDEGREIPSISTFGLSSSRIIDNVVLKLDEAAHRQVLTLERHDNFVGGCQGVDREKAQ